MCCVDDRGNRFSFAGIEKDLLVYLLCRSAPVRVNAVI